MTDNDTKISTPATVPATGSKRTYAEFFSEPSVGELIAEHEIVPDDEPEATIEDELTESMPLTRNMRLMDAHVAESVAHGYGEGYAHPTLIWSTDGLTDAEVNIVRFALLEAARGSTSGNDVGTYSKVLGPCQHVTYLEPVYAYNSRGAITTANRLRNGVRTAVKNHVFRLKDRALVQLIIVGPSGLGAEFATALERILRRTRPGLPDITFRASPIDRIIVTGLVELRAQDLIASAPYVDVPAFRDMWQRAKAFNYKYHKTKRRGSTEARVRPATKTP